MEKENFTLKVDGMMCEHCKHHVVEAIKSIKGAENVSVSLEKKEASFTIEKDKLDDIKKAIKEEGYEVK